MMICDTHCDTLYMRALQPQKTPCVTMEAMKKGGMSLQTCTLYAGNAGMAGHPYDKAMAEYRAFEHLRDTEGWTRVDSPLEAEDGKVKILLSVEGGEIFEGKVERVHEFYGYGVRMAALTWNNENEIGHSAKSGSKEGIKPVGWEILRAMAELKMAADTSHLNEAGFWDLIDRHSQPPMASHSCATALCSHFRNLTDEQISIRPSCRRTERRAFPRSATTLITCASSARRRTSASAAILTALKPRRWTARARPMCRRSSTSCAAAGTARKRWPISRATTS